jgi:hypothetical protein
VSARTGGVSSPEAQLTWVNARGGRGRGAARRGCSFERQPKERAMTEYQGRDPAPSGWAIGGTVFAGVILLLIGFFHAIAGLVALLDDEFYVVARNYTFDLNVTSWGWIHLIGGTIAVLAGLGIFAGATWARVVGIAIAMLSAIISFFFIPYYPWWSLLIIALDIWVIWALSRPIPAESTI